MRFAETYESSQARRLTRGEVARAHRCHFVKPQVRVHCYADGNPLYGGGLSTSPATSQ